MFSQLPAVCTHCRMVAGVGVEPTRHASWHKPGCIRFRNPFPGEKVKKAHTFEQLNAEIAASAPEVIAPVVEVVAAPVAEVVAAPVPAPVVEVVAAPVPAPVAEVVSEPVPAPVAEQTT